MSKIHIPSNLNKLVHNKKKLFHICVPKTANKYFQHTFATQNDQDMLSKKELAEKTNFQSVGHCYGMTNPHDINPGFCCGSVSDYKLDASNLIFANIRNPFDMLVSIYSYGWSRNTTGNNVAQGSKSFDEFIKKFTAKEFSPSPYFHKFLFFQLFDDNGIAVPSFLLKLEYLWATLPWLTKTFDLNPVRKLRRPLGPAKVDGGVSNRERDYKTYYTDETRALVEQHFSRELQAFGYSFDGGTDTRAIIDPSNIQYKPHTDEFELLTKETKYNIIDVT